MTNHTPQPPPPPSPYVTHRRCPACRHVTLRGDRCPHCGAEVVGRLRDGAYWERLAVELGITVENESTKEINAS